MCSAIMAMNSELVGFPFMHETVFPKYFLKTSGSPPSHARSIAWRIARSALEGVVLNFFATPVYTTLIMLCRASGLITTSSIASQTYWYPLMLAGMPISCTSFVTRWCNEAGISFSSAPVLRLRSPSSRQSLPW